MSLGGQVGNEQEDAGKDGFQTGRPVLSKDNGDTWTRVNSLNPRPMYFSQVRVDPPTTAWYVPATGRRGEKRAGLWRSTDGGKTLKSIPGVHAPGPARHVDRPRTAGTILRQRRRVLRHLRPGRDVGPT